RVQCDTGFLAPNAADASPRSRASVERTRPAVLCAASFAETRNRPQGCQVVWMPFVKLNVSGWQKLAPFLYQHWYVRTSPGASPACDEIVGSPAPGYCEEPEELASIARRTTEPPAQRKPSPNTVPDRPFTCVVPWK